MILWLKGVVFNVTTVDLKRWVLLPFPPPPLHPYFPLRPLVLFSSAVKPGFKKDLHLFLSLPFFDNFSGRFHKGLSGSVTLWSSPTSNTLLLPHCLFGFPMTLSQARENLRKINIKTLERLFKVFHSAYFLPRFWWATCYFLPLDPETSQIQANVLSHVDSRTSSSLPNPLCFYAYDSSKCSLNGFPLASGGQASARLFSGMVRWTPGLYGLSSSCVWLIDYRFLPGVSSSGTWRPLLANKTQQRCTR